MPLSLPRRRFARACVAGLGVLLLCVGRPLLAAPSPPVTVHTGEVAAGFHLIDELSAWAAPGLPTDSPAWRYWQAAGLARPGDRDWLERYRGIRQRVRAGVATPPTGDPDAAGFAFPFDVARDRPQQRFARAFLLAADWRAARRAVAPLLAAADRAQLDGFVAYVRPRLAAYWRAADGLRLTTARLSEWLRAHDLSGYVARLERLFGLRPGQAPALRIVVVPRAALGEGSRATVEADVAVIEAFEGLELPHALAQVSHEYAHRLYERMPHAVAAPLTRACFAPGVAPRVGAAVCASLYEAVATAVGQGDFVARFFGVDHQPRPRWYDDATYDRLARAIEPLVRAHLDAGRPLDPGVVAAALSAAGPLGVRPGDAFRVALLAAPGQVRGAVFDALRTTLGGRRYFAHDPDDAAGAARRLSAYPGLGLVVAVTPADAPALRAWTADARLYGVFRAAEARPLPQVGLFARQSGAPLLVLLAAAPDDLPALVRSLGRTPAWPEGWFSPGR